MFYYQTTKLCYFTNIKAKTAMSRLRRMNKAQFMNICDHVAITVTLQIYSRLTPIVLSDIPSSYFFRPSKVRSMLHRESAVASLE